MSFYIISALMVIFASLVIFARHPVYSALWLVACLLSQAALFATMGAHLVAVLQVLLYAGAIIVFLLFVIMLLDLGRGKKVLSALSGSRIAIAGACFYLASVMGLVLWFIHKRNALAQVGAVPGQGTVESVAEALVTKYVLPFELTAALLLAAVVAAITMAGKGSAAKKRDI